MAKPTKLQIEVIEAIRQELDYWIGSNDIHSPSHNTSIENDMFHNMDQFWPEEDNAEQQEVYLQLERIIEIVQDLRVAVLHVK